MSIPTQIGVNGQGSPIYRFDAIPNTANAGPSINAADFAQPNDAGDFSAAVTRALTAAGNGGGGRVILPPYPVTFQNPAIGNADNLELIGFGWNSQIVAGSSFPSGSPLIQIQAPGGAGNFRYGLRIAHLYLNGNSQAGVGGLDLVSSYGALVEHVRMRYLTGIAVHWDGISGAFGAYNYLVNCHITDGVGASAVGVQTDSSEWLTVLGGHIGYYQTAGNTAVLLQNLNNRVIGTSFDYVDTAVKLAFAGRNHVIGCQFDRGFTRFVYLESAAGCVVANNFFGVLSGSGTDIIRADGANNDKSIIANNTVEASSGWTNFYHEYAGIGGVNTVADNDTGGTAIVQVTGLIRNNHGYNPVGKLAAQPTVPASGTAYVNSTGIDCTVYLTGGTFTGNHQIGGQSIGNSTATVLRVAAGQSVTLTYSAAPTWLWIGD